MSAGQNDLLSWRMEIVARDRLRRRRFEAGQANAMIKIILKDSEVRPDLFDWRGSIPISEIEEWEREQSVSVPEDLKQLWNIRGGGDLFESETILQPSGPDADDLVLPRSEWFWRKGLDSDCYAFHEGLYISTFRRSDDLLCSLNSSNFGEVGTFRTLDDWYLSLRAEYGDRYGLPPLRSGA